MVGDAFFAHTDYRPCYLCSMHILLLDSFHTGSHRQWSLGFQKHSSHEVELWGLPGRHWKWRMHGAAVTYADRLSKFHKLGKSFELILATDMLDLTTFLALTRRQTSGIPTAVYFHENQITYPWSPTDSDVNLKRNNQYGFINFTSALAADRVFFNSDFHRKEFLAELPKFLRQFPDHQELESVEKIAAKSEVLHLGMDLKRLDENEELSVLQLQTALPPVIGWNHRWEYDKGPDEFFETLFQLSDEGVDFRLIVLGEAYQKSPPIFAEAKEKLADKILHFGYAETFEEYAKWLWQIDFLPVTSRQDFFGGSVVEAMYCNCFPLLPKRLAYPEHLPPALEEVHFYENDFLEKMRELLTDVGRLRRFSGRQYVERYDWGNCIEKYDKQFVQMKAGTTFQ